MPVAPDPSQAEASLQPTVAPWKLFSAAVLIVLAGALAYGNSLRVPFVYDDTASIVNNDTIQHGLGAALAPPTNGETVMGRPLLNWSLAVNYALSGLSVRGYHLLNLVIHLLAALALFGLVRRTLELPSLRRYWGRASLPTAMAAALLWVLHPLQTESVTYIIQRAESLAGLFYLLTFYFFVRALGASRKNIWLTLSAAACLGGAFCKETIVTAPVLVLLYDRAFAAGTLAAALKQRGKYYAALVATWIPLAWLVGNAGSRGGSAGFDAGVSPLAYALTQARAVVAYLDLSLWPHPLVFDYGNGLVKNAAEVAPQLAFLLTLLAATVYLLWKRPALGFLSAWFIVTLAPSSSFVPITTETMAEHRLYLPLAAIAVLVALGLNVIHYTRARLVATSVLALLLGWATFQRNAVYHDNLTLWRDTAQKSPEVARAHVNYAAELLDIDHPEASAVESRRALELQPDYPEAENNLGNALARLGHPAEAAQHFAKATLGLRLPREKALAYLNLGSAFGEMHQLNHALTAYTHTTQLLPDYAPGHNLRGYVLAKLGRYEEAIAEYELALKIQPDYPQCTDNLIDAKAELILRKL